MTTTYDDEPARACPDCGRMLEALTGAPDIFRYCPHCDPEAAALAAARAGLRQ